MDELIGTVSSAAVPTLAVIAAFVRNESAISDLGSRPDDCNKRIETMTRDMNTRFETLTRRIDAVNTDLREWAKISLRHNTEIV